VHLPLKPSTKPDALILFFAGNPRRVLGRFQNLALTVTSEQQAAALNKYIRLKIKAGAMAKAKPVYPLLLI